MNYIAIDFGGTTIKAALIIAGEIVERASIPAYSESGLAPRLPDTEAMVRTLLAKVPNAEFAAVGIAMPGIVDAERCRVTGIYNKYEDSMQMDLPRWCEGTFHLPLTMGMDSKLALLGELYHGCARGFSDAAMLILGTGVGTAVALGGEIIKSKNHAAGALCSHIIIEMKGRKCTCPSRGCLEAMASGWALPGIVKEHPDYEQSILFGAEKIDFRVLQRAYAQGDAVAADVVAACVAAWRTGILNMIHAFNPEVVVLSGAVMNFEGLYELLTADLQPLIWDCCRPVEIRVAEYPEDSVLYGIYHQLQSMQK